jgi:hypothetical protein
VVRAIAILLTIAYALATIIMLFYHRPAYQMPETAFVFVWFSVYGSIFTLLLMILTTIIVVIRHKKQKRADWGYLQKEIKLWRNLFLSITVMLLTVVAFGYWL